MLSSQRLDTFGQNKILSLVKGCELVSTSFMFLQSLRKPGRSAAPSLPEIAAAKSLKDIRSGLITNRMLNFAGAACLLGGGIGILKATEMERAIDIVICLVGSVAVCCCICYLWLTDA